MEKGIRRELIKQRLREELELSTLTFTEIAKKIGVTEQMITQYKNTNKLPTLETFSKLCEILGADPAYILGLTNNG